MFHTIFTDAESDVATSPKEANGEVKKVRRTRSRSGSARRPRPPALDGETSADGATSPTPSPTKPKKKRPKQKVAYSKPHFSLGKNY